MAIPLTSLNTSKLTVMKNEKLRQSNNAKEFSSYVLSKPVPNIEIKFRFGDKTDVLLYSNRIGNWILISTKFIIDDFMILKFQKFDWGLFGVYHSLTNVMSKVDSWQNICHQKLLTLKLN